VKIKITNILLLLVFTLGIVGSGELVWTDITAQGVCPKILGVPACYIVLICFIIPFASHILKMGNVIYFTCTGLAFIIALIATIMQLAGNEICPKSIGGIALCYYSLVLFSSLLILKRILIKNVPENLQDHF